MNSIFLNGFSLNIISDNPVEKVIYKNSNYFSLPHRSEYAIQLSNNHEVKADAHVWIDNEKIGVWRISSYGKITIERPANINRKFVLLKEGTTEARGASIHDHNSSNGLVKVVFYPEKIQHIYWQNNYSCEYDSINAPIKKACGFQQMSNNSNLSHAGTALGDDSYQRFRKVESLTNVDDENITTIYARLVVDDTTISRKKYISLNQVNNSMSIPPPLYM